MPKSSTKAPAEVGEELKAKLNGCLKSATEWSLNAGDPKLSLSKTFITALDDLSAKSASASTGFTNIITALAIKLARPTLDVRCHQVQIGAPFSFRGLSEDFIHPWLSGNDFEGALSGWQTRTFERPKPYTMDFAENIGGIKNSFLTIYDRLETHKEDASEALAYLIYRQIQIREKKKTVLAKPNVDDVNLLTNYFYNHFFSKYKSKGASRLPVLAIFGVYEVLMTQLERYKGKKLKPLERHSAADSQTGSFGDIEILDEKGKPFEAVEIKHDIPLSEELLDDVCRKIMSSGLTRYYILTTHGKCQPSPEMQAKIDEIRNRIGCQVIVNGVMPSLKYYLRLIVSPSVAVENYVNLLSTDKAIAYEHRIKWNEVVSPAKTK